MKDRIIMKYRLFGLDGIKNHEKQMLIDWKIITPLDYHTVKKLKKRVKKYRKNRKGNIEEYSTDMSGSNESCYSYRKV